MRKKTKLDISQDNETKHRRLIRKSIWRVEVSNPRYGGTEDVFTVAAKSGEEAIGKVRHYMRRWPHMRRFKISGLSHSTSIDIP